MKLFTNGYKVIKLTFNFTFKRTNTMFSFYHSVLNKIMVKQANNLL